MEIKKALEEYIAKCGDKHAYQNFINYRGDHLGSKVIAEWLAFRMNQDMEPFTNIDGSINKCVNSKDDTENFIKEWCLSPA